MTVKLCELCHDPIDTEIETKTDGNGEPVHDKCAAEFSEAENRYGK